MVTEYAKAFNLWMDEYINNPEQFIKTEEAAIHHLSERLGGKEYTYGDVAAETFKAYLSRC